MRFSPAATATFAFLTSALSASAAHAQEGALAGVVSDETGALVNAADVAVRGSGGQFQSSTNAQGRFTIAMPVGIYDIVVSLLGHETTSVQNVSVSSGQTTSIAVMLPTRAVALTGLVVTDSRTQTRERAIESTATTDVITGTEISERPTFNPADHLRSAPGVDIATTGLQNSNVVVRGFNNIFSGSLHMLSDYRLAGVPSLRVNLMHFIPTIDEDLDRMEVVLGPASALYGPNTANGVVHFITKSPLDDQRTTVTVGGGTKSTDSPSAFQTSVRSSFLLTEDLGFKISGQYLDADEWEYFDPAELQARDFVEQSQANMDRCIADRTLRGLSSSEASTACNRIADRSFDLQRWSFEARADWRFTDDGTFVATYGRNNSSGIELTGLGAGQTEDWVYDFFQGRLSKGKLFAQGYLNRSNSGSSFLLRDGVTLVDESSLVVGQIQHGFEVADGRQELTYGFDYFGTSPESDARIYGTFENDDDMDEWGIYLQSKTEVSPRWDVILAGRLDDHSVLDDQVFSPRAAVVFKPNENHGIRLSYNSAFSTPTALNFFLDISGGFAPPPVGALGFTTRAFGSGREGWSLRGPDSSFEWMRSPLTPSSLGGPRQLLRADVATLWQYYVGVLQAGGGIDAPTAGLLASLSPTEADLTRLALDVNDNGVTPLAALSLPDLPSVEESRTETIELGWTGVLDNRVSIAADVYRTTKNDFVSPLTAETPLIFLDPGDVEAFLTPVVGPDNAAALARPAGVDDNGVPNPLPLGVVSSDDVGAQAADIIVSYRNVGDITLYGGDLALQAFLTDEWALSATYSYVSDDVFEIQGGEPIALNAPQHKGSVGVAYRDPERGFSASTRLRFNSEFEAFSADFAGVVENSALVDLTASYQVPNSRATVQLSVTNLFGNLLQNADGDRFEPYRSFVGAPEIGRFTMLRVKYDLF